MVKNKCITIRLPAPLWLECQARGGSGFITATLRTQQARESEDYSGPKGRGIKRCPEGMIRNISWSAPPELEAMFKRKGYTYWLIPILKVSIAENWVHQEIIDFMVQRKGGNR